MVFVRASSGTPLVLDVRGWKRTYREIFRSVFFPAGGKVLDRLELFRGERFFRPLRVSYPVLAVTVDMHGAPRRVSRGSNC